MKSACSCSRLLTLLLVLLLGYLGAHTVNGSPTNLGNIPEYSKKALIGSPVTREYYLASHCSQRNVQMILRGRGALNALGEHNKLAVLTFESQGADGRILIRGEYAKRYLCFSRHGRLILRNNESNRCLFYEDPVGEFVMLRSFVKDNWYVGFNKRGKKLKGFSAKGRGRKNCTYFKKMLVNPKAYLHHSRENYSPLNEANPSKIPRPDHSNGHPVPRRDDETILSRFYPRTHPDIPKRSRTRLRHSRLSVPKSSNVPRSDNPRLRHQHSKERHSPLDEANSTRIPRPEQYAAEYEVPFSDEYIPRSKVNPMELPTVDQYNNR